MSGTAVPPGLIVRFIAGPAGINSFIDSIVTPVRPLTAVVPIHIFYLYYPLLVCVCVDLCTRIIRLFSQHNQAIHPTLGRTRSSS